MHAVYSLKEGFTANHPCRDCMASLEDVRKMAREDINSLRTPEQYNEQILEMEQAQGDAKK